MMNKDIHRLSNTGAIKTNMTNINFTQPHFIIYPYICRLRLNHYQDGKEHHCNNQIKIHSR